MGGPGRPNIGGGLSWVSPMASILCNFLWEEIIHITKNFCRPNCGTMWHLIVKGMCLNVWVTLWNSGWRTFLHGNPGNGLHYDWSLFGLSYGEVGYNSVLTHARGSQKDPIVNVPPWHKRSNIQHLPMLCTAEFWDSKHLNSAHVMFVHCGSWVFVVFGIWEVGTLGGGCRRC